MVVTEGCPIGVAFLHLADAMETKMASGARLGAIAFSIVLEVDPSIPDDFDVLVRGHQSPREALGSRKATPPVADGDHGVRWTSPPWSD